MFLSPFSISTALAMTYAGARGDTATQMASVLHLSGDQASIAQQFGTLLTDLNSAGQSNYALSVADALWGQQGLQFLSQFLDTMQTDYGGGLNQVDFIHQAEAARQTINAWVAQHTNDKIQDLFPAGSIDQFTRLVLANAIYFKGNWATAFNAASTHDANFTLASGANEQVPTMHGSTDYRYMQSDGFQVLELPYAGGRLAMDVLLPNGGGSAGLSVGQLPSDLNSWFAGLGNQQVDVSLPKFTHTTNYGLSGPLQALGMPDAFTNAADFSGITDPTKTPLKISGVVHKAYIGVDETGTEAAAATGVGMIQVLCVVPDPPPPIQFNADHPFLFMIRDTQSGSVLFMGQEADPLNSGGDSTAPGISPHAATPTQPVQPPPPITVTPVPIGPMPKSPSPGSASSQQQAEIALVMSHWLSHGPAGDMNHDGIVNGQDIAAILSSAALASAALPRPTAPSFASSPVLDHIAALVGPPDQAKVAAAIDHVMSNDLAPDGQILGPIALSAFNSTVKSEVAG
jgi:serpin B